MATSIIDVCNNALIRLGANTITTLDDASDEARACRAVFWQTAHALIEAHPWRFATKRVRLTAHADTPASGYDYQYPLPADYLFALQTDWDEDTWVIEAHPTTNVLVLLSDETSVVLEYVAQLEAFRKPLFLEMLSVRLAAILALPIGGKESWRQSLLQEYQLLEAQAVARNARERGVEFAAPNTALTRVRYGTRFRGQDAV